MKLTHLISNPDGDSVLLGDGVTRIPRLGTIDLDLHFAFLDDELRMSRFALRYAVINIPFDIILGVEALRSLFPNDDITRYFPLPSHTTTTPLYLQPTHQYHPYTHVEPQSIATDLYYSLPTTTQPTTNYNHLAAVLVLNDQLNDMQLSDQLEEAADMDMHNNQ